MDSQAAYLLDTCAWIDAFAAPENLKPTLRRLIDAQVVVSVASISLLEVARKEAKGDLGSGFLRVKSLILQTVNDSERFWGSTTGWTLSLPPPIFVQAAFRSTNPQIHVGRIRRGHASLDCVFAEQNPRRETQGNPRRLAP